MAEPVLSVQDLRVSYGRVRAVDAVSLTVAEGEAAAVVGANGAGKTSLLSALSGLVRPAAGHVLYAGTDVTRWPAHRLVSAGVALVPEGRLVLAGMTVAENLQLAASRRGDRGAIDEMYERFGVLAERRNLPAGALSGGEQQMLAIARALVTRPRLMLMDEPSMGLAPRMVDEVFAVIKSIRAAGVTIVLVEQNARQALRAVDTGYVLETGNLVHSGPAQHLLEDPRVVQAYLGG